MHDTNRFLSYGGLPKGDFTAPISDIVLNAFCLFLAPMIILYMFRPSVGRPSATPNGHVHVLRRPTPHPVVALDTDQPKHTDT
jgi:hypothetical protein